MPSSTGKLLVTLRRDRIGPDTAAAFSVAGSAGMGGLLRRHLLAGGGVVTSGESAVDLPQHGLLRRAPGIGQGAARMKGAAAGPPRHGGWRALDGLQAHDIALDARRGRKQA